MLRDIVRTHLSVRPYAIPYDVIRLDDDVIKEIKNSQRLTGNRSESFSAALQTEVRLGSAIWRASEFCGFDAAAASRATRVNRVGR